MKWLKVTVVAGCMIPHFPKKFVLDGLLYAEIFPLGNIKCIVKLITTKNVEPSWVYHKMLQRNLWLN